MAPELRSHPLQLSSLQQYQTVQFSPVVRYGVGVCVGIATFKWLKRTVRKVPVVGPVIAGVMPAMLLGAVAGVAAVYGVQKMHDETEGAFQDNSNDVDVHQLLDDAGAGFQQVLGAAGNAANDAGAGFQQVLGAAGNAANDAGAGFQQALGTAGNAANDAAITVQAAVVAAATVAGRELEYVQRISASANDVEREVVRFMHRMRPQPGYVYQRVFEQTKRKLQQEKRRREHQW